MPVAPVEPSAPSHSALPSEGYTVQHGDTLTGIAEAHGVSLQALEKANPQILHPDLIFAGQHVNIPEGGSAGQGAPHEVTVKAGDTLSGIAQKLGVDWRTLAQVNHLSNPDLITPGETLEVPGGGGGRAGGAGAATGPGAPSSGGSGARAYDIAKSHLGQNASSLKTETHDKLPMDPNCPSDECCANFVSAVLVQAGELPASAHTDSVQQLKTTLEGRGWQRVDAAHARPGDVVIMQGGGISHTEMVADGGRMIGSNNTNADGTQKVGYNSLSYAAQHGGIILRAPGGDKAPAKPAASQGAGGVGPAASTTAGRAQQAVSYFESQGWTHAQAAGLAANLQTESGFKADDVGDGGSAYGIGQWHPDRQAAFQQHFGHSIKGSSFSEQLQFVNYELRHGNETSAGHRLEQAQTAGAAGAVVSRYYERPLRVDAEAAQRAALAQQIAARTR